MISAPVTMNETAPEWDVVQTDNFARETVAERYAHRDLVKQEAERIYNEMNDTSDENAAAYFVVRHQSKKLWGGMAELV